jgi:diguanylate cyclase (GGDEF)-like protein
MFATGLMSVFFFVFYLFLGLKTRGSDKQHRSYLIFSLLSLINAIYVISFAILINSGKNIHALNVSNRLTIIFSMFVILLTYQFNKFFFEIKGKKDLIIFYIINTVFTVFCVIDTPLFLAREFFHTSKYYTGLVYGSVFQIWGIYVIIMMLYSTTILLMQYLNSGSTHRKKDRHLFYIILASLTWYSFGIIDALTGIQVLDLPPLTWAGSLIMLMSIQFVLITTIQTLYNRIQGLYQEVTHDSSTQVFSKNYFEIELDKRISESSQTGILNYVVLVDVDDFKSINDQYGHVCGDFVLKRIADIMKVNLRQPDIIARYGGDEFVILIKTSLDLETVVKIIERLRMTICNETFIYESRTLNVTCSFGLAAFDRNIFTHYTREQIIDKADTALYESKRNGKNKVHVLELN